MKKYGLLCVWAYVLLASSNASAGFYKWVDERGVTHYSASPPSTGKKTATRPHQKFDIRDRMVGTTAPVEYKTPGAPADNQQPSASTSEPVFQQSVPPAPGTASQP